MSSHSSQASSLPSACWGLEAPLSIQVSFQGLQLPECPRVAVTLRQVLGPNQTQCLLHALQLKVETLPVDAILPSCIRGHLWLGVLPSP